MTAFRSRNVSVATVPVEPERIWDVLTQPALVAEMTPLVDRIERKGQVWTWTLAGISGLGLEVAPSFTVRMTFSPISRIDYRHEPPPGVKERAGVNGTYLITQVGESSSKLKIDLALCVDLPLPRVSRRAVEPIMAATMARAGAGFARNLYRHLGLDENTVAIRVIEGSDAT